MSILREILIDGRSLTLEAVEEVASAESGAVRLHLDSAAAARMRASHSVIEQLIGSGEPVYGMTTGFGRLAEIVIEPEDRRTLQHNLIRSHASGVGEPLPREAVRAVMLLRANALARGYSGCRVVLVERLLDMLERGIQPTVPKYGSVGASGDLAPLAHVALSLLGEGRGEAGGEEHPMAEILAEAGLEPMELGPKEGLALINGTQATTGLGILALLAAERAVETAEASGVMSMEALLGTPEAFREEIQMARPHSGQVVSAARLRALIAGSEIRESHRFGDPRVQDAYSLRCIPQVHGAARSALAYVRGILEVEANSATDNPLVFPRADERPGQDEKAEPGVGIAGEAGGTRSPAGGGTTGPSAGTLGERSAGTVLSGGNFHAQIVAQALDLLAIVLADVASMCERRIERLINPDLSLGLPAFLARRPGLESGFMVAQVVVADLLSEMRVLAHPASVDSVPTSASQEDHVSMGPAAARKACRTVLCLERILAAELMCAAQGIDYRRPLRSGLAVERVHALVRSRVETLKGDRSLTQDLTILARLVRSGAVADITRAVGGDR